MKYLLLLTFLVVVWWLWRKGRVALGDEAPAPPPAQRIVMCAHCGVHVPESDAVSDGRHAYCSERHRQDGPATAR